MGKKTALITLVLVLGITAAIVGFVLWDEARASERRTAEAEVIGFVATPDRWWDSGDQKHVEGHTLTFSWVDAENQPHTETLERITWYDAGRRYKVCYNPADPGDRRLYQSTHVCGS